MSRSRQAQELIEVINDLTQIRNRLKVMQADKVFPLDPTTVSLSGIENALGELKRSLGSVLTAEALSGE